MEEAGAVLDVMQRNPTCSERSEASRRLGERLKKGHAQVPKVDEEEAERLINAELTKMRAARRKQTPATHQKARSTREKSRHRVKG